MFGGEDGGQQEHEGGEELAFQSLETLDADTTYYMKVSSANQVPTFYEMTIELEADVAPVVVDLGERQNTVRKDIILGGPGNDILMGGAGEEWIIAGPGNDVLSGGYDRMASDVLFGEGGNDIFQIFPDQLPFIKGTNQTYIPTLTDVMDGGEGDDQVLFLGGDTDDIGRDVPDVVALNFNTNLHRWEFASWVWDTANQEFLENEITGAKEMNHAWFSLLPATSTSAVPVFPARSPPAI